ncbi:retrotransposon protein, putative, ty1-copia subclass, partial [Tanacetum coccineum]
MAPMALSDSEVKTCSKTYLKNHETLKKQYDGLRTEFNKSQFNLANYKRGLASVEEQLAFYRKNEVIFGDKIVVLKRDVSFKDSNISWLKSSMNPDTTIDKAKNIRLNAKRQGIGLWPMGNGYDVRTLEKECPVYLAEFAERCGSKWALPVLSRIERIAVTRSSLLQLSFAPFYDLEKIKESKHNLDSTYLWAFRLAHINKKRIKQLQQDGLLKSTDDESFDKCESCLSGKMTKKPFPPNMCQDKVLATSLHSQVWERFMKRDTPDKLQQRSVKCIFIGYPKETMGYYFYFPPKNKIVVTRYAEFFEKNLITQEVSGRAIDLEEIQDEDTSPSEITSEIPIEVEEVEEHSLGDLNKLSSYKATMLDSESNKWIDAMNAEIQSMMDNMVWVLVDLPPGCKTIGSKWIFKKKTEMDGIVQTYKARLVAKGYTQLYGVDYEETFSPVTDIRAIRILISIADFYDYEIWQMDVELCLLKGAVDWKSSKHSTTAMSATEAKYIAALKAVMEAVWIRKFISGL